MYNTKVKIQAVYFEKPRPAWHLGLFDASGKKAICISDHSEPTEQKILDLIKSTEKSNKAPNRNVETLALFSTTISKLIQIGHHSTQGWCEVSFK